MSASHNPGGPDYDWGIKVNFQLWCSHFGPYWISFDSVYLFISLLLSFWHLSFVNSYCHFIQILYNHNIFTIIISFLFTHLWINKSHVNFLNSLNYSMCYPIGKWLVLWILNNLKWLLILDSYLRHCFLIFFPWFQHMAKKFVSFVVCTYDISGNLL